MNNQNDFTVKNLIRALKVYLFIIPVSCHSQYISSTTDQIATTYVLPGSFQNPIIRVAVTIGANAVSLDSLTFTHNGCTNPGIDIVSLAGVKVFYTASSNIFSTIISYGTYWGPSFPVASFSVGGNLILGSGVNYLWLTYDISPGAVACDYIDAACTSVIINGVSQTPTIQAPSGSATITNCATAITDIQINNNLFVFLNPLTDELTIKTNNEEMSEVLLYDVSSKKILQQRFTNSVSINTKQFAKGIYIYEIRDRDGSCKKGKVVKD